MGIIRSFKCLALHEENVMFWADNFNVGFTYKEAEFDTAGEPRVQPIDDKEVLLLIGNNNRSRHVDSNCFEMVTVTHIINAN